jgi:hypothetical protein
MLRLPNEVLLNILQNLYHVTDDFLFHGNKTDLLSSRAVCKRLADLGAYAAFRHMTLKHDLESYQRILAFSRSKHRDKLQAMTYSFESFEPQCITRDEFPTYIEDYSPSSEGDFSTEEMDIFQREYCRRHSEMCLLESSKLDTAHLAAILLGLTNLRSVCISQCFSNLPWVDFEYEDYQNYNHFLEQSSGPRVFDNIAAALRTTDLNLSALTLRSYQDDEGKLPLTGIIQSLSSTRFTHYQSAFQELKVLSIFIPEDNEDGNLNLDGLLTLINSAPSLEKLELSSRFCQEKKLPPHFLKGLNIPKLHAIRLQRLSLLKEFDLSGFFSKHSSTLRRVELCDIIFDEGSWEEAISHMRDTLMLDSSNMMGCFCVGDWHNAEIHSAMRSHGRSILPPRAIESFIERRSDANPFELLRTNRINYPPHASPDDIQLCRASFCPYYCTPEEAAQQLKQSIRAYFRRLADSDPFVTCKTKLLATVLARQGRLEEGTKEEIVEKTGEESGTKRKYGI